MRAQEGRWLLVIDTATSVVVVAAGTSTGDLLAAQTFPAGHRHGSHLLPTIQELVEREGLALASLGGVVVGLGPGAFTGLRVGLATAKTLAHGLGVPIVGVSTGQALLEAAPGSTRLLLPAGPHDRVIVESDGTARLEAGDRAADDGATGDRGGGAVAATADDRSATMAVDLDGRAPAAALALGHRAVDGLPTALLRLGARRLSTGAVDDVERLVPAYVSLPRGITTEVGDGGVAWSRDPR